MPEWLRILLSGPSADSVFTVFGQPENPVETTTTMGRNTLGGFDPRTRTIQINEGIEENLVIPTLAHESAHEALMKPPDKQSRDFKIFLDSYENTFRELSTANQIRMLDNMDRYDPEIIRENVGIIAERGQQSFEIQELMADNFARMFGIARTINQFEEGVNAPEIQTLLDVTEDKHPRSKAAFNLIMKALQGSG